MVIQPRLGHVPLGGYAVGSPPAAVNIPPAAFNPSNNPAAINPTVIPHNSSIKAAITYHLLRKVHQVVHY